MTQISLTQVRNGKGGRFGVGQNQFTVYSTQIKTHCLECYPFLGLKAKNCARAIMIELNLIKLPLTHIYKHAAGFGVVAILSGFRIKMAGKGGGCCAMTKSLN